MVVFLGITDLGINLPVLLGQTLSFLFLLFVLKSFVYKPILSILDERRERIREGLSAAERARTESAEASRAAQEALDAARREGAGIVEQARIVGQRLQEEARQDAGRQHDALLARAQQEIQMERDAAIAELRREFADLTISAAEKVIGQSLDATVHQRLIETALEDSSFQSRN